MYRQKKKNYLSELYRFALYKRREKTQTIFTLRVVKTSRFRKSSDDKRSLIISCILKKRARQNGCRTDGTKIKYKIKTFCHKNYWTFFVKKKKKFKNPQGDSSPLFLEAKRT